MQVIAAVKHELEDLQLTTVRQILYKLVSNGTLASTKEYDKLVRILRDARIRGEVDDLKFVDNKREVIKTFGWDSLEERIESVKSTYSRNVWLNQTVLPIVLVEKGTVGLTLEPICRELQVPLVISSGYQSRPILREVAQLMLDHPDKSFHLWYVGDHDPSGLDMEKAAQQGNDLIGTNKREGLTDILTTMDDESAHWSLDQDEESESSHLVLTRDGEYRGFWRRVAVTHNDLLDMSGEQLLPLKEDDPRTPEYRHVYGDFGAEVEALDQHVLIARIRKLIEHFRDGDAYGDHLIAQSVDIDRLETLTLQQ